MTILKMTLEQAIQHAKDQAEKLAGTPCGEQHAQLSGWLSELLAVREAQSVPAPIAFSENADADMCRTWAWEQVKKDVTTDGWTAGDSGNFYGFYCWGWDMRRQYNEQRPPAVPEEPPADLLPKGTSLSACTRRGGVIDGWKACRAAMLNHSGDANEKVPDDTLRMDWLVAHHVEVRKPLLYGSEKFFTAQTMTDEEDDYHATSLREQIDAAMAAAPTPTK